MVGLFASKVCHCDVLAWRFRGRLQLTAIVKGSWTLPATGIPQLMDDAAQLANEDIHGRQNPARSVSMARDRLPYRSRADVVLSGHAHSYGESIVQRRVRLELLRGQEALINKEIEVRGSVAADGSLQPFDRITLSYERAFGGHGHPSNPTGTGIAPGDKAPNLYLPNAPETVAGYGPISELAKERRLRRGELDADFLNQPLVVFPENFDWGFFQAAPLDQQVPLLHGDETLSLFGMHPAAEQVKVSMPSVEALAAFFDENGHAHDVPLSADTMHIDTDRMRVSVVWRGSVGLTEDTDISAWKLVADVGDDNHLAMLPDSAPSNEGLKATASLPDRALDATGGVGSGVDELDAIPFKAGESNVPPPGEIMGSSGKTMALDNNTMIGDAIVAEARRGTPFVQAVSGVKQPPRDSEMSTVIRPPAKAKAEVLAGAVAGSAASGRAAAGGAAAGSAAAGSAAAGGGRKSSLAEQMKAMSRKIQRRTEAEIDISGAPWSDTPAAALQSPSENASETLGIGVSAPEPERQPPPPLLQDDTPVIQAAPSSPGAAVVSPWLHPGDATAVPVAPPLRPPPARPSSPHLAQVPRLPSLRPPSLRPPPPRAPVLPPQPPSPLAPATPSNLPQPPSPRPPLPERAQSVPPPLPNVATAAAGAVQLLWFDPRCLSTLRASSQWSAALDALAEAEVDPALAQHARDAELGTVQDYCDVAFVLSDDPSLVHASLNERNAAAILADHTLVPPLVRLDGVLQLTLEPRQLLRTTADIVRVLRPQDDGVEQAVAAALALLEGEAAGSTTLADLAVKRIHSAFVAASEAPDAAELETLVERVLIGGRHYRTCELFGGAHVCGSLKNQLRIHDIYLRSDIIDMLPLASKMETRVLAEVRPPQEVGRRGVGLRIMAIARTMAAW